MKTETTKSCNEIYEVLETFGIYPAAVKESNGEVIKRSRYKDGWNEAVMGITDKLLPILEPYIDED